MSVSETTAQKNGSVGIASMPRPGIPKPRM